MAGVPSSDPYFPPGYSSDSDSESEEFMADDLDTLADAASIVAPTAAADSDSASDPESEEEEDDEDAVDGYDADDEEDSDSDARSPTDIDTESQDLPEIAVRLFPFRSMTGPPPPPPSLTTYRHPGGPLWRLTPRKGVFYPRGQVIHSLPPSVPPPEVPLHTTRETLLRKRGRFDDVPSTTEVGQPSRPPTDDLAPSEPDRVTPTLGNDSRGEIPQLLELIAEIRTYRGEVSCLRGQVHDLEDAHDRDQSLLNRKNRQLSDAYLTVTRVQRDLKRTREELLRLQSITRTAIDETRDARSDFQGAHSTAQTFISTVLAVEATSYRTQTDIQEVREELRATTATIGERMDETDRRVAELADRVPGSTDLDRSPDTM